VSVRTALVKWTGGSADPYHVSLPAVLARMTELQQLLEPRAAAPAPTTADFAGTLQGALVSTGAQSPLALAGLNATPVTGGTAAGQAMLRLAQAEVGVAEQPPGSNDAPRIAQYRQATAGSGVGPWCAYFVSWAAREVGAPLGDAGQGYGLVADVWSWAQRSGKAIPASSGPPQSGDLIVWNGHIGIVESVAADGTITTIEGNSSDQVSRRTHDASGDGALGWVRVG
jgi:hypothetical protein